MGIQSSGLGVMATNAGVVTDVTPKFITIGNQSYPVLPKTEKVLEWVEHGERVYPKIAT